ncbi:MAG: HupE/UreJ family protein [Myxococcota bacterium]
MSAPRPARATARRALTAAAAALLCAAASLPASAHPLAPSSLRLDVAADHTVAMTWRTPTSRLVGSSQQPELPPHCRLTRPPVDALVADGNAIERRATYDCAPTGLIAQRVGVHDLAASGSDAIVHITLPGGRTVQALLHASAPSLEVPAQQSPWAVAADYLALGAHHLALGLDHLAFILGLLLLVRGRRRLLGAVTAFTVGHSLTLALATLGLVRLPPPLVELGIAASIIALALEAVTSARTGRPGPIARHPAALCAAFGLLHGLGFAGALSETGLPDGAIPLALFAFNLGIEIGQLAFISVIAALWSLAPNRPRTRAWPPPTSPSAAGLVGSAVTTGCSSAPWPRRPPVPLNRGPRIPRNP